MANVPIEESLGFDISQALSGIQQIDDALGQVVQSFQVGLASALETLTSAGADVPPLADTLDVAGLGPAVDAALADAGSTPVDVTVDADTAPLTDAIDTAVTAPAVVDVSADTAEATAAIDALNTAPVTVDVDADTSGAQDALDALGTSATSATGGRNTGLAGLSGAVLGVEAATGAASGEVSGFTGVLGGLSSGLGEAVAGGAAFTAFIGETIKVAADAQAQQARFNDTFGASAEVVKSIDVGGLTISLEELGKQSGTTNADLEASATRIGLLGAASGAAKPQVAGTASDLLGLAGALAVANPRLGDTATVADTISRALSTGRTRSLIPYGISLTQTAIQAEALRETQKQSATDLTGYDKLVAGLTLALQQQGDTLGGKFKDGVQNAQVQLRALKTQLEETLVAIGTPLLGPVTQSLTELLPVAQEVGRVLGEVAQIVLPLLTTLGPPLAILADGLGLVAEGVHAVGDVLHEVPGPTALVVGGLGLLTVAFDTGTLSAASFGLALDAALGPIGFVVGALTILGGIGLLGGFSKDAKQAAVDTSALSAAFESTSGTAGSFSGSIAEVNTALDKYLAKNLTVGDVGNQANDALILTGTSLDTVKQKLISSDAEFTKFSDGIANSKDRTDETSASFLALDSVLRDARVQLEAGAHATLQNAIQTGLLTRENIGSSAAWADLNVETNGAIATLEKYEPLIRAAQRAQVAAQLSTGALQQAFLDLRPAIAAGTITTDDAQTVADSLHISLDDAKSAVDSLSKAMDAFVSTGLAALPSAGTAIDDFASGISSAQSNLDSVLKSNTTGIDPFAGVSKAQDQANRAISDNAEQTARSVQAAKDKVAAAQADLAAAEQQGGTGQAAAIKSAQGKVQTANDALARELEQAGQSHADAVRSGDRKVADARQQGLDSQSADAKKAREAQDAYLQAIDPQRVIDAELKNTLTIAKFQQDLATLLARGRDNAVAAIIAEGPAKGSLLAGALVSDDTKAKAFDNGIALANQITSGYGSFLEQHKAELSGRLITLADGTVVDATDSFSGAGGKLAQKLLTGIATPLNASPQVKDAVKRLAEGGAAAFDPNLAAPSKAAAVKAGQDAQAGFVQGFQPAQTATDAVAKVPAAIQSAIQPAIGVSATAGVDLTAFFAGHLHFGGEVSANLESIPGRIVRAEGTNNLAAASAGFALGIAYGEGFAGGISGAIGIAATAAVELALAADKAARKALGVRSPSTAGKDLGRQYVAGIVQGLAELDPLHAATAALTLALVPDIRPALRQTPSLASGIVAATPAAARPAAASTSAGVAAGTSPVAQRIESTITLNKTDPDPKHFADELAWALQGL